MTLQEEEQFISDLYGEPCCPDGSDLTLEEANDSILECQSMLDYAIEQTNKEEIAFWRKMLQKAKVVKRSILTT